MSQIVRFAFIFLMSVSLGLPALAEGKKYEGLPSIRGKECAKIVITFSDGKKLTGVLVPEKYKDVLSKLPGAESVLIRPVIPNHTYRAGAWIANYHLNDEAVAQSDNDPVTMRFKESCNKF